MAQMKGDGHHLTNESADIVAEVETTTQAMMTQHPPSEEMENFEIIIRNEQGNTYQNDEPPTAEVNKPAHVAPKIIGKGGERVKEMKGIYCIDNNTTHTGDNDRTFTIIEKHQNVEKVAKIIRDIAQGTQERGTEHNEKIQNTNARPQQRPKIPTRSRFYAKGTCRR